MQTDIASRREHALSIVQSASQSALDFFRDIGSLSIEQKGLQDLVSNADKSVELQIRAALASAFPDDGIVGEEHDNVPSSSGFTWIIDPIDGTANFVRGIPGWCVVLACVAEDQTVLGVICDAVAEETYVAVRGEGATLNGKSLKVSTSVALDDGSVGVGLSNRSDPQMTINALESLINADGVFYRNASGALMLAYVAAGRLIGYCEPHMNSWDCMAALLMIEEAGGKMMPFDRDDPMNNGTRVITACPGVFDDLVAMCEKAYNV